MGQWGWGTPGGRRCGRASVHRAEGGAAKERCTVVQPGCRRSTSAAAEGPPHWRRPWRRACAASLASCADSTPTAPPQCEATRGSTCVHEGGRGGGSSRRQGGTRGTRSCRRSNRGDARPGAAASTATAWHSAAHAAHLCHGVGQAVGGDEVVVRGACSTGGRQVEGTGAVGGAAWRARAHACHLTAPACTCQVTGQASGALRSSLTLSQPPRKPPGSCTHRPGPACPQSRAPPRRQRPQWRPPPGRRQQC